MSDEFEKWPSNFQKPGEEEEDHTLVIGEDDFTLRTYSYTPRWKEDRHPISGNVENFWRRNKHRRNI